MPQYQMPRPVLPIDGPGATPPVPLVHRTLDQPDQARYTRLHLLRFEPKQAKQLDGAVVQQSYLFATGQPQFRRSFQIPRVRALIDVVTNSHALSASPGTFTITGFSATLAHAYKLTVTSGSYTITGGAATFSNVHQIVAGSGVFTITGSPVDFRVATVTHPREILGLQASLDTTQTLLARLDNTLTLQASES